ncbi:DUF397 domain-containing protein [Streptomyces sp. NPDC058471]|uniref:DUF397 domain-containing protein n=1 Tax=Streptomyces sp. NPDC058471 TaxID=3346516 RepID=UPI00364F9DB1
MSTAQDKEALYSLDLSDVEWKGAPGTDPQERVEIAYLPGGAVALRNAACPDDPALVYTEAEWQAFVQGARNGELVD